MNELELNIKAQDFKSELTSLASTVEDKLKSLLPTSDSSPNKIHEAMLYSVLAGGKRIRPILCIQTAKLFSDTLSEDLLIVACALEMVHTYSLIHDDLPSMDDDNLRRGKPTNHKKFGEALAILSGDALLTFSFECLSSKLKDDSKALKCIKLLSHALGTNGMIGGQVLDIEGERQSSPTIKNVEQIHNWKTGALLQASMALGAIMSDAPENDVENIKEIGLLFGRLFQITDDILDIESTSQALGKTTKKDLDKNKITYPRVIGLEKSKVLASELAEQIKAEIAVYGVKSQFLSNLVDFIVIRKH
ncbi:MAG: hypothetical protein COA79_10325 [Planctomycetota bacterium]|nr:MAG: hypothetical protein COA79_10325 [Planctomycetota bacterium]